MINFVTVHWQSPKWIDVQLQYLERHAGAKYRVYASLNGIEDTALRERFHFAGDLEGGHAEKLNELASMVVEEADPADPIVFVDGDAFPIRPLVPWISDTLATVRLAAVRRDESLGDCQPHPCFCVTTAGFWREIGGDWRPGGTWIDAKGAQVTDVGGTLLHQLRDAGVPWLPLLRSNTTDLHPLWYAVYDHRVYHHGAGFRSKVARIDKYSHRRLYKPLAPEQGTGPSLQAIRRAVQQDPSTLLRVRPRHAGALGEALGTSFRWRRNQWYYRRRREFRSEAQQQSDDIFSRLRSDPEFFLAFDATPVEA